MHGSQFGDLAVLTIQIGDGRAVGKTGDDGQVVIIVATQILQRGVARDIERGQVVTITLESGQRGIVLAIEIGEITLGVEFEGCQFVGIAIHFLQFCQTIDALQRVDDTAIAIKRLQRGTVGQARDFSQRGAGCAVEFGQRGTPLHIEFVHQGIVVNMDTGQQ